MGQRRLNRTIWGKGSCTCREHDVMRSAEQAHYREPASGAVRSAGFDSTGTGRQATDSAALQPHKCCEDEATANAIEASRDDAVHGDGGQAATLLTTVFE